MCILESGSKSLCQSRPFWTENRTNRRHRQCKASAYIWEGTIYGYFTLCIISKCVFPTLPFTTGGCYFPGNLPSPCLTLLWGVVFLRIIFVYHWPSTSGWRILSVKMDHAVKVSNSFLCLSFILSYGVICAPWTWNRTWSFIEWLKSGTGARH